MQSSIFHVHSEYTNTFTILHQEIESKVLDEEVGVVAEGLTVEGVEDSMTWWRRGTSE